MKKNIYIVLAIFCILLMILLQNVMSPTSLADRDNELKIDEKKLLLDPYNPIFITLSLTYSIIFLAGIINLSIFTTKKLSGITIIKFKNKEKKLNLSQRKASKLLFLIMILILAGYLLTFTVQSLRIYKETTDFVLFINIALQITISLLILNFIKAKDLGLDFGKKKLIFMLRVYSATLPVVFMALLLNNLLAKNLDLRYSLGPAVELFLTLNNKISTVILIMQIVIFGPIAEELFFRGFIYKISRNKYSPLISAIIVSLVFSLVHRAPFNLIGLFVLSIALCYIYEKTQSILAPITFHATHNIISLSFLLLIKGFN
jgi:hypothetical protein